MIEAGVLGTPDVAALFERDVSDGLVEGPRAFVL